jgi:hypothetical protein
MEEFRIIQGFERYSVSNLGRVRREIPGANAKVGVIKNAQVNKKTGYTHCKVSGSEGKRSMAIHRLVAEAFIPNPEGRREIDHINRDKTDNRAENLRWSTRRENMANIAGRKALCPILAYPPDGGEPIQFECMRDAAKYIADLTGQIYFPQGISNVLNNSAYTHYKGWKFEKLPAEK